MNKSLKYTFFVYIAFFFNDILIILHLLRKFDKNCRKFKEKLKYSGSAYDFPID